MSVYFIFIIFSIISVIGVIINIGYLIKVKNKSKDEIREEFMNKKFM